MTTHMRLRTALPSSHPLLSIFGHGADRGNGPFPRGRRRASIGPGFSTRCIGGANMRIGIVLIAALMAVGCSGGAASPTQKSVRVAAAADVKFAFDDLSAVFRAKHPDIAVQATYGASGDFFAQLSNGAPFDLFLSADVDYPRKLVEQSQGVQGTEFTYAIGHLVVWLPKASTLDVDKRGLAALADPAVRKIALANPRHAPYGRAAESALKHAGVYEQVKDRLVFGENVAQAAQLRGFRGGRRRPDCSVACLGVAVAGQRPILGSAGRRLCAAGAGRRYS